MTHRAKKIRPGLYHYRGYEVEKMSNWDTECKFWNIRELTEDSAHDSENTKRQCLALIDFWIDG